jgi:O-antigen/teichoic acid export membrane protein
MSTPDLEPTHAPEHSPLRDLALGGRSLRDATARGTIVNGAFTVGLSTLGLVRGFLVAAFLTAADYGIWGIIVVAFGTLMWLKQVGVNDKYIQQEEGDQEAAFQRAFTLELLVNALFLLLVLAAIPVVVLAYGRPEVIAPTLVLLLILPAVVLQTPMWVFYRRMDFVRQRSLQAVEPVVAFAVTVGCAIAGTGYWAFVLGGVAGAWTGALVALLASPYRVRLRYDRGTLREYVGFSGPLFFAGLSGTITAQVAVFTANHAVGLAGVGAIALANVISDFAHRVDGIVTQTIYPAICAVQDRTELLFETFVKSNRLTLMWAVPFGAAVALFARDIVSYGIGEKWRPAVGIIEVLGVCAAVNHIGFNWDAFFRARSQTRPIAVASAIGMAVFLAVAIPLLIADGLHGYAIGLLAVSAVALVLRGLYLARLFDGFDMARHAGRAIAPTLPAAAVVLTGRWLVDGRSLSRALVELAAYALVTVVATFAFERDLLREVSGYLRRAAPAGRAEPVQAA